METHVGPTSVVIIASGFSKHGVKEHCRGEKKKTQKSAFYCLFCWGFFKSLGVTVIPAGFIVFTVLY